MARWGLLGLCARMVLAGFLHLSCCTALGLYAGYRADTPSKQPAGDLSGVSPGDRICAERKDRTEVCGTIAQVRSPSAHGEAGGAPGLVLETEKGRIEVPLEEITAMHHPRGHQRTLAGGMIGLALDCVVTYEIVHSLEEEPLVSGEW